MHKISGKLRAWFYIFDYSLLNFTPLIDCKDIVIMVYKYFIVLQPLRARWDFTQQILVYEQLLSKMQNGVAWKKIKYQKIEFAVYLNMSGFCLIINLTERGCVTAEQFNTDRYLG